MIRILSISISLTLLSSIALGQSAGGFKAYKNQEDYCRENPKMPTCIKTGPFVNPNEVGLYKGPITGSPKTGGVPRGTAPLRQPPQMRVPTEVPLHDWRFSHLSPAMLINVNIKSLLQSPVWTTLFSTWTAGGVADLEKARAALSDIGQVLISIGPRRSKGPSVLILAMGNVDSPLGALLRSSEGMQSKRLNAFSMLVGDPDSLQIASMQMQSPMRRTTWNTLQQTATLESMKYDVWVGIDPRHLPEIGSMMGVALTPGVSALANLRGLSLGIYLRDQIRVEVELEAPSPEMAQRMLAAYQQQQRDAKDQVWVSAEGAKVRYIAIGDAKELTTGGDLDAATMKAIAPQIGSAIQALAKLGGAPRADAPTPRKQPLGAIVIQGLDTK